MTRCHNCHQEVPDRKFCVRCGAPLQGEGRRRSGFAAAPHEHRLLPSVVSSLFPHLPRAAVTHYRVAMGVGTVTVLALGIAGLFPLALAGAAVLVPILTALYLHDVNVYEDEPYRVIAFTLVWGAVCGVGIALLAHALEPGGVDRLATGHTGTAWVTVVLLPILEFVLAIAGPVLFLLPRRRFSDVLDGVTFGAASAAALSATVVIVNGYQEFSHGLAPGGAVLPWVWRLLTLRLALPILAMAATGAACGALWLRYRGPEQDREALGPLGHPAVAFALRAAMLIAAAAGQRWLPVGAWLATLLVLDAIALVWLRLMLQLGLREESAELEIGPDVRCPNCGSFTPNHTFCAECGVALRALPKRGPVVAAPAGAAAAPAVPMPAVPAPAIPRPTRLVTTHRVLAFAGFLGAIVVAAGIVGVIAPAREAARCVPSKPCGAPPTQAPSLTSQLVWRSPGLGYQIEYSGDQWAVNGQDANDVDLASKVAPVDLVIQGASTDQTPAQLVAARVDQLRGRVLGLTGDPVPADTILGPAVGYQIGAGNAYVGAIDSPQGIQNQVFLNVMASRVGGVGIVATTVTDVAKASTRHQVYGLADSVINSVTWPGQR
jgi:hypothetical protein